MIIIKDLHNIIVKILLYIRIKMIILSVDNDI